MRFQRANYLVSDKERALLLYREVLGMELEYLKDSPADSYSYEVFDIDPALAIEFATLSYQGQPRVLALTILGAGNLAPNPSPRRSAIVIEVESVEATVTACQGHGFKCFRVDQLVTPDGREGKEAGILDDDGNLVVIYNIEKYPEA